jgi:hypothetical protein
MQHWIEHGERAADPAGERQKISARDIIVPGHGRLLKETVATDRYTQAGQRVHRGGSKVGRRELVRSVF